MFLKLKYPLPPETLINFICRLEEIGAAAAKEHSLEKALEKMKLEWKDMMFEMIPYRETVRSFLLKNKNITLKYMYEERTTLCLFL